jgi:WD40 repeat protein
MLGRLTAALSDRYRIERQLGEGGMATVYLAHDLKHDRDVAIKVLRAELAAVIGAERFLSEIKTTANLQHPHILPLFDSGSADGQLFYVMPYVQGDTLRDRLNRETQLPVADAVRIATEIASALDYAHKRGVVHRDIKPENILLQSGSALVADFGIALAVQQAGSERMTQTGMSLGTPQYMSPEQAMGEKHIDARADIYALAAVTYEMLVGEPPFTGPSVQAIVAKVMAESPKDVAAQRKTVPVNVAGAVAQALEKLPADRFASAADFAAALEGRFATKREVMTSAASFGRESRWQRLALGGGVVAVAALGVATWALLGSPRAHGATGDRIEFAFQPVIPTSNAQLAISRDGRRIGVTGFDSVGKQHVYLRELGNAVVNPVSGTEGGLEGFDFSPDGNWLAVVSNNSLIKVPAAGGPATVLATGATAGVDWGLDGTILFTKNQAGLWRMNADGSGQKQLTHIDTTRHEFSHWYAQSLPGGKAAIFNNFSTPIAQSRIEAIEYASGKRTVLVDGAFAPRYVDGYLLFLRERALFAVRFDPNALKVSGTPVPVLEDVRSQFTAGYSGYTISESGTLVVTRASNWRVPRRVIWADRTGAESEVLPGEEEWAEARRSPDGRWIALTKDGLIRQLWLLDVQRKALTQLTHTAGESFDAVWMPDSKSLIHSVETPVYDIQRLPIDGTAPETLRKTGFDKYVNGVSRDGKSVLYSESMVGVDRLWRLPLGGGEPTVIDKRDASQRNADLSPDGRWYVYEESEGTLAAEVYVRAADGNGGRRQISAEGGTQPRWTKGGREIVYRRGEAMIATPFDPAKGEAGLPVTLFRKPEIPSAGGGFRTRGYDVLPDGSRFLMISPVFRPRAGEVVVITNWLDELRKKVGK